MRTEELAIEKYVPRPLPTLRDVASVLFRQRWPMLAAFALVLIAVGVSGFWVPKYESQMKILVRRQRSDTMVTSSANAPSEYNGDQVSEEDLNSEVELLNSQDLLRKVVLATGLAGNTVSPADHGSEVKIAKAVRKLAKDLKIQPLRKTNVISVSYQSRDPEIAANVLKTLATEYMAKDLEVHRSSGEFKFFDQQTQQYRQRLEKAQEELTAFNKKNHVVSADVQRDSALRQADEFEAAARQAQAAEHETEERADELNNQLKSLPDRLKTQVHTSSVVLEQLKATQINLELKRTELLTKYEPSYPLVQEVDKQIADTKASINKEMADPTIDTTTDQNPDYQWVRAELTKAMADLSGLKARADSASSIAANYREAAQGFDQNGVLQQGLLRTAKMQEENFLLYAQKREEARISDALDQRGILNVALAEQPVIPALPSRSSLSMVLITLLLAGTFSLSTAYAFDFMDPSFRTPDELASYLGAPVLAALPRPPAEE